MFYQSCFSGREDLIPPWKQDKQLVVPNIFTGGGNTINNPKSKLPNIAAIFTYFCPFTSIYLDHSWQVIFRGPPVKPKAAQHDTSPYQNYSSFVSFTLYLVNTTGRYVRILPNYIKAFINFKFGNEKYTRKEYWFTKINFASAFPSFFFQYNTYRWGFFKKQK